MAQILFNRGLVLAKIEVTFNVDPVPVPGTDALLVAEPDYSVDPTVLERTNLKSSITPDPVVVARKVANLTFTHEVRGSGDVTGATAPAVGPLLQACGMSETQITSGTDTIIDDAPIPVNGAAGTFTFAKTTGYALDDKPRVVTLECTTPGGTGVAAFTVSSPAVGGQAADSSVGVVMTDATAFEIVTGDAEITPTIVDDFEAGDTYVIHVVPPGYLYEPVSESFDSATFYTYYDGLRHIMTGARGTFTMEGSAGNFANFNFDFQGSYADPTDTAIPGGAVFESTLPNQVELANIFATGGIDGPSPELCAQEFNIDIGNNIVIRECINAVESVEGAVITARTPTGSFNPEMELEATHPFWANLGSGERVVFGFRVGKNVGNVVSVFAPYAQYSDLAYGNRNDIRIYDVTLNFAGGTDAGNDELRIHFS